MTRLLASVQNEDEALAALAGGADIIDFKNARAGALGALDPYIIASALLRLNGRALTSATAGDWPLEPAPWCKSSNRMSTARSLPTGKRTTSRFSTPTTRSVSMVI